MAIQIKIDSASLVNNIYSRQGTKIVNITYTPLLHRYKTAYPKVIDMKMEITCISILL